MAQDGIRAAAGAPTMSLADGIRALRSVNAAGNRAKHGQQEHDHCQGQGGINVAACARAESFLSEGDVDYQRAILELDEEEQGGHMMPGSGGTEAKDRGGSMSVSHGPATAEPAKPPAKPPRGFLPSRSWRR